MTHVVDDMPEIKNSFYKELEGIALHDFVDNNCRERLTAC